MCAHMHICTHVPLHTETKSDKLNIQVKIFSYYNSPKGVVGCGEGDVYFTSPGRPTEIGLQLGKACYPCSR